MSVPSQSVTTTPPAQPTPSRSAPASTHFVAAPAPPKAAFEILLEIVRRRYLAGFVSVAGGLALWEFISRYLVANSLFLASPSQIAVAIYDLARTGQLGHHVGVSAAEFALGYVIACAIGIALGLAMAAASP